MTVLNIQEGPEDADDGVDDGNAGVKGEFGDLGGGEIAVCVAELDSAFVLGTIREGGRADAIIPCSLNWVLWNLRIFEVDLGGKDLVS